MAPSFLNLQLLVDIIAQSNVERERTKMTKRKIWLQIVKKYNIIKNEEDLEATLSSAQLTWQNLKKRAKNRKALLIKEKNRANLDKQVKLPKLSHLQLSVLNTIGESTESLQDNKDYRKESSKNTDLPPECEAYQDDIASKSHVLPQNSIRKQEYGDYESNKKASEISSLKFVPLPCQSGEETRQPSNIPLIENISRIPVGTPIFRHTMPFINNISLNRGTCFLILKRLKRSNTDSQNSSLIPESIPNPLKKPTKKKRTVHPKDPINYSKNSKETQTKEKFINTEKEADKINKKILEGKLDFERKKHSFELQKARELFEMEKRHKEEIFQIEKEEAMYKKDLMRLQYEKKLKE